MNTTKLLRNAATMVVLGLALSFMDRPAQAITLTWDSSGLASSGTTIVDGSGTWDTATPEWWNSSSSANQAWNNSDVPSDTAVFGVGSPASNPYTVTLNTGITVGGITFANQAYTISGNTLSLSPPSGSTTTIAVNSGLVGTINSAVSDGGSGFGLSKTGAGTLVMNGPATYSGATTVSGGTLLINSTDATSAVTVSSAGAVLGGTGYVNSASLVKNAYLEAGAGGVGSLTFCGLYFQNASRIYVSNITNYGSAAAIDVTGNNALTALGGVTFYLGGTPPTNTVPQTAHLLQFVGSVQGAGLGEFSSSLNTSNFTPALTSRDSLTLTTTDSGYIDLIYHVDYPIWTGAGNGIWTTATQTPTNWKLASTGVTTNFLSNDAVVFDDSAGTAGGTTTVSMSGSGSVSPSSVTFNNNRYNYTLQGQYGIVGPASLTINSSGAVTISNSNSYTGGTTLNAGQLNIANASALGGATSLGAYGAFTINGGTIANTSGGPLTLRSYPLNLDTNLFFGGSNPLNLGAGNVTLGGSNSSGSIYVTGSTLAMGGIVGNAYGLTLNGAGLLAITGSSNYAGPTSVNGGTLSVGNGGSGASIGSTSGVTLANNTTLLFNHADAVTFAPAITGAGNLIQGGGFLVLANSTNSYSGGTTITGGTLQAGSSAALGATTAPLIMAPGTLFDVNGFSPSVGALNGNGVIDNVTAGGSPTLTIGNVVNGSFSGTIQNTSGALTLVENGPAVQVLSGTYSYTGGTQINGGTLQFGNGVSMNGSLAGNVVNNSALVFANPFAQTYGGVISGNGSLTKSGTGLLLITADQTYTGPTNINAGLVRLAPTTTITVSGFGANTNGTTGSNATWTINTNTGAYITTPVTGGTLTLTDNSGNEERSAFYNTVVPVGAFTASFIYQAGGSLGADGAAFMLQNDPRGLTALGGYGGGFGYGTANGGSPITPSAGIGLNIYSGANSGNGLYFLQGGLVVTTTSTSPVSLGFGDPINVSLSYDGSNTLAVAMTDATLSESYSASYPIGNLASLVGGNTAYLGFSGATGGEESTQTISNFTITTQGLKQALPPTSPLFIASGGTLDLYGCTQAVGDLSGSGMVTNTAAGTAASLNTGGDNTTQTYAGVIADNAGTVALIKSGLGGLTLTGTNRYSGGTTIVAGTLQLGNSAAMGTGALAADGGVLDLSGYSVTVPSFSGASGTVTNSGSNLVTLTVSQSATTTFGGSISDGTGPVGLKLTGSGGLYLTGSNAYSGPTTINAGLLLAAAPGALSPSSAVNITGGTLDVTAAAQTIAALAVGKSGALNLSIGNLLSSNGTVAFASGSTLNILGSIIFLPDVLISYSGAANGTFTKVNYDGAPLPNSDLSYSNGLLQIVNYSAGPPSWIAGSDVWSNGANWSGGSSPSGVGLGALLNQTTSGTAAITLDVPVTLGTLQFGNSAGLRTNYLLGGNLLTFNNNGATASVTVLGGTHTIAAPVLIQSGNLDIVASNSGSLSISGNIADDNGQRSLMLDGDGTGELILSGTNSYGGGTIVNAGTLIAASATALADGSSLTVGQGASSLFAPAVAVAGPSAAAPAGVVAVPEPGTLWLLFVALWSAKACLRFSKRSPLCYTARGMK